MRVSNLAIPAIVSTALCFQPMVLGPLTLLGINEDINLASSDFIGWPLLIALATAIVLFLVLWMLKRRGFLRPVAAIAAIALFAYVQFYLFSWDFGIFDGQESIAFRDYRWHSSVEIAAFAAILIPTLWRPDIFLRPVAVAVAMFFMAQTAIAAWNVAGDGFAPLSAAVSDSEEEPVERSDAALAGSVPHLSADRNVIIMMLDTFQGDVFEKIIKDDQELSGSFSGFNVYTHAVGVGPYTVLSMNALLTGEPHDGSEPTKEYIRRVRPNSLERRAAEQGYTSGVIDLGKRDLFLDRKLSRCLATGNLWDLYLFRQLPTVLKHAVYNDGEFLFAHRCISGDAALDISVLKRLTATSTVSSKTPTFNFIHLWGMHPPATVTAGCQPTKPRRRPQDVHAQGACILGHVADYLDRLRALSVFDNSMIFIVADHGWRHGFVAPLEGERTEPASGAYPPNLVMSSANPIVAFKDFGATGGPVFDDREISLLDVHGTVLNTIGAENDTAWLDLTNLPDKIERTREFTYYKTPREVADGQLLRATVFHVDGSVRDPAAWGMSKVVLTSPLKPLAVVDLSSDDWHRFTNIGWRPSGAGASVIGNPASIEGILPSSSKATLTLRLRNPHKGQSIRIVVNGREEARTEIPRSGWKTYSFEIDLKSEEQGEAGTVSLSLEKIEGTAPSAHPFGVVVSSMTFE